MKEQLVIIKHSSVIQASNATPRLARQLWNALLFLSFDDLLSHRRHAASLDTVLHTLDVTTRNVEHLKDFLCVLQTTLVEFNILHKDLERWESSTLLAAAKQVRLCFAVCVIPAKVRNQAKSRCLWISTLVGITPNTALFSPTCLQTTPASFPGSSANSSRSA